MHFNTIKISCIILILVSALSSTPAIAASPSTNNSQVLNSTKTFYNNAFIKNLEISAAGGPNWFSTNSTHLVISPFETNSVKMNGLSNEGIWKVGIGYYLFDKQLATRQVLNHLLFEINVYSLATTLQGTVWQYQLTQFNNYNFRAPASSTRLMFDFKPNIFTAKRVSPYLIFGVGPTWNTTSYRETVTGVGVNPDSALILGDHTTTQFAWDLGAGLTITLTDCLNATIEYVYAFLGNGSPANQPANNVNLITAPSFSMQAQSLLLGLSLKL